MAFTLMPCCDMLANIEVMVDMNAGELIIDGVKKFENILELIGLALADA